MRDDDFVAAHCVLEALGRTDRDMTDHELARALTGALMVSDIRRELMFIRRILMKVAGG